MKNSKVTVKQMIEALSQYDENMPVEIVINQYNKRYPVAYITPTSHSRTCMPDTFATCMNGVNVRIDVTLPYNHEKFMLVSERKLK